MLRLRKVVFYLFVTAYLVACPLTILYAFGYVFRPGTEQGMLKTGVLSLATAPPGAAIYVNGRRYTKRTPAVLQGLRPGAYRLTLAVKHHEPWGPRMVSIEAEKATVLDRVLLLPRRLRHAPLLPDAFDTLLPIPETHVLLLMKGPKLADLVVYDWDSAERWPFVPPGPFGEERLASPPIVTRGSPFVLVRVKRPDGERILWAELRNGETRLTDLTRLFPARPLAVAWDPRAPERLFSLKDSAVNRLEVSAMTISPRLAGRVRGFGVSGQTLYVLTEHGTLQRLDVEGRLLETVFGIPRVGEPFFGAKSLFRLTALTDERILLLGERGEFVAVWRPFRLVEDGVRGFELDARRQRLLVWRRDRVGVMDLAPADAGNGSLHPPELRWVFEEGRDIEQAFWVYDGSQALLQDHGVVTLLAWEPDGEPMVHELLRVKPGRSVHYTDESGRLYYLDRATGRLCALDILPRREPGFLR